MRITLRGLAVAAAAALVAMILVPVAVEILLGEIPRMAIKLMIGLLVTLPALTSVLMLADWNRQRRRHENQLSAVPVVFAVAGAAAFFWVFAYQAMLPKEQGVAIGLGIPYLLVPPLMLTVSLVHWSASRSVDAAASTSASLSKPSTRDP